MTPNTADLLNFVACSATFIFTALLLWRLERKPHAAFRFVFHSFVCWTLSWAVWCSLWGMEYFWITESSSKRLSLLCLSDLNTVFVILFYRGLTRGKTYGVGQYALDGFLLTMVVAVAVTAFYLLGSLGGRGTGFLLHEKWSLALGMCSPVVVGWAMRLRYHTVIPLAIGFTYALAQPAAYEALFGQGLDESLKITILVSLSFLKILWASSVSLFLGAKPLNAENLVRRPKGAVNPFKSDRMWLLIVTIQLLFGLVAVTIVLSVKTQQKFQARDILQSLIGGLVVAGLVRALMWLFAKIRNATGLEDPDSAV